MISVSRFVIGKEVFTPSVSSKANLNESNQTIQFNQHLPLLPYVDIDRVVKGEHIVVKAEIVLDEEVSRNIKVAVKIRDFAKLLNVKVENFEKLQNRHQLFFRIQSVVFQVCNKREKEANKENCNTLNMSPKTVSKSDENNLMSTFAYYSPELEEAVKQITAIPEGREAIRKAQKVGRISVCLVEDDPSTPIASWESATREIFLDRAQNKTLDNQIWSIIFEVHNAQKQESFAKVDKLWDDRKIDIITCARRTEILEYQTYVDTSKLYKIGRDDWGLFPPRFIYKFKNLDHCLKVQVQLGHTKMYIDDMLSQLR